MGCSWTMQLSRKHTQSTWCSSGRQRQTSSTPKFHASSLQRELSTCPKKGLAGAPVKTGGDDCLFMRNNGARKCHYQAACCREQSEWFSRSFCLPRRRGRGKNNSHDVRASVTPSQPVAGPAPASLVAEGTKSAKRLRHWIKPLTPDLLMVACHMHPRT